MAKFDINKKGYDTEQVDTFINKLSVKYEEKLSEQKDRVFSLKNELSVMQEKLDGYKDKDKQISQALIFAVEKAEQIENKARRLYDLEVKRLRLLYKQWEALINRMLSVELPKKVVDQLIEFNSTVSEVLEQNNRMENSNVIKKDLHNSSDNYIKNILNKMDYAINEKPRTSASQSKSVLESMSMETERENNRAIDLSRKLDKIKVKGSGNMADNYLNADEEMDSPYANNLMHKKSTKKEESGFDLEDALNPKEDLDEIMKAFDFFIENDEEKNKKSKSKK